MRVLTGLILALLALQAAASPALPPDSLRFRHLNATQKLTMEAIWSIAQDGQGFIWMGAQDGLRRFDGHRMRIFRKNMADPSSLADNDVRRLFVDPLGTLWVGSRGGLQHYDPATESFVLHKPKQNVAGTVPRAMVPDGNGGFWIGTFEALQHFDPRTDKFTPVALDQPAVQQRGIRILDMVRDGRGRLWIARSSDLIRYDPASGATRVFASDRCHPPPPGARVTQSRKLLMDGDLLWYATTTGLERLDTSEEDAPCTDLGKAAHLATSHIVTMLKDRENDIWMSVDGIGLMRWRRADGGTDLFHHVSGEASSIGDNMIQSLAQDRSGTLWVGTLTAGMSYVDLASGGFRRIFRNTDGPGKLSSNSMTFSGSLQDGRLWFATLDAGVNLYDPKSGAFEHLLPLPPETIAGLNNGGVFGLAQDRQHRLWVTSEMGLHRYDARTRTFDAPRLLADPGFGTYIFSLHADPDGMLWGTTRDGVRRFDPETEKITAFRHDPARPDSLSSNRISKLMRDSLGIEWVVTNNGIELLDPATGKVRRMPHSLFGELPNVLHEDRRHDVWIGLTLGMLHVRRTGAGFAFEMHRLPSSVNSILEGDDGWFWLGTDAGISLYDPRTRKAIDFTSADGLADGSSRSESALRTSDGTMYFGSYRGGITYFHPAAIRLNTIAPPVRVTGVLIDNQALNLRAPPQGVHLDGAPALARQLTLSHRQATFAIEFSAMHYGDTDRNVYAYRLIGHDDKWTRTDAAKPFALYGSLPPGTYRFQVMAANKNGVWSPAATELSIKVTPAVWATPWFRALAGLVLLAMLWLTYHMRVRMLISKQLRLEAVVAERTAQVRDTLRELTATQEHLVFREKMASVGTLTAGIAHEINNPANFAHVGAQLLARDLEQFRSLLRDLAGDDADADVVRTIEDQFDTLFERIGTIADGTTRIRDLVKDLRTFARLDEAEKKEVDLIQSLQSTIQLVRPQYAHEVEFVTAFETHPRLECWPAQLNQVFMNVIVNACQAIEARRREDAHAPPGQLAIRSREEDNCCVLEFEDNGCGIAPAVLARVFEPFFTTKDIGSGTGLGLSISFGIVARHRGTIVARSKPGAGTCFTIRLPMTAVAQPA